jgi:GGDEF domain-containing protein
MALLSIDALALHRRKRPPFPYALLLFPMAAAIGIALKTTGVVGGFWASPTVLFFYFVLRRAPANACSLAMLAAGFPHGVLVDRRRGRGALLPLALAHHRHGEHHPEHRGDLHRRLVEQAITDPLTGTFNRRHMQTRLEEAIERGRRAGSQASLLIIDIDHFKAVNDRFGHEAGDHVLKELVSFLRERSRKADLLFRMGGEEFLLLLNDTAPRPLRTSPRRCARASRAPTSRWRPRSP